MTREEMIDEALRDIGSINSKLLLSQCMGREWDEYLIYTIRTIFRRISQREANNA